MKYLNKFLISHLSPVHLSEAVYINIIPTSIETGNFQYEGKKYAVQFEFNFLNQDEQFLTKGKALSDQSICETLKEIKENSEVDLNFVVYDVESPELVGSINEMSLTLNTEELKTLRKYIKPLDELGSQFEKVKEISSSLKDKLSKKLHHLGDNIHDVKDKSKKVACKAIDKAKNADISKKEAALIGAGTAVVVLSLLHKCLSRK